MCVFDADIDFNRYVFLFSHFLYVCACGQKVSQLCMCSRNISSVLEGGKKTVPVQIPHSEANIILMEKLFPKFRPKTELHNTDAFSHSST